LKCVLRSLLFNSQENPTRPTSVNVEINARFQQKKQMGRISFDIAISIYTNLIFGRQKSADLGEVRTKVGCKAIGRNVGVGNARRLYRPP
jgi:hypothetical protein